MIGLFEWVVLLLGILVWPQMALCVLLYYHGYWILGTVALVASFYSGKDFVHDKIRGGNKTSP